MSVQAVREYLAAFDAADRVLTFSGSSATVALAAEQLGVSEGEIAKTLSFYNGDDAALLIVAAGDRRIDNAKFKARFGMKARMLHAEDVQRLTGFLPGGVCPFTESGAVTVWLDESLREFTTVYPAAGDAASAVRTTPEELLRYSRAQGWVDVCKAAARASNTPDPSVPDEAK